MCACSPWALTLKGSCLYGRAESPGFFFLIRVLWQFASFQCGDILQLLLSALSYPSFPTKHTTSGQALGVLSSAASRMPTLGREWRTCTERSTEEGVFCMPSLAILLIQLPGLKGWSPAPSSTAHGWAALFTLGQPFLHHSFPQKTAAATRLLWIGMAAKRVPAPLRKRAVGLDPPLIKKMR